MDGAGPACSGPKVPGSRPGRPTKLLVRDLREDPWLSLTATVTAKRFSLPETRPASPTTTGKDRIAATSPRSSWRR